jgi:outer membrane protein OmpA-like peptidoglycan-associated protein
MTRCRRTAERGLAALVLAATLAACTTQSGTVVLLPEQGGRDAAVTVRQGERTLVLDRPYAAADLTSSGPQATTSSAAEVQARYGAALAAQPMRPTSFTLYFVENTDTLTEASQRTLDGVIAEIARYPVPDIVVVGHTDLVGTDVVNDALARKRADTVRTVLIGRGVAPSNVVAVGRGKREPAVPTADGVAEPRNRRVVILVR